MSTAKALLDEIDELMVDAAQLPFADRMRIHQKLTGYQGKPLMTNQQHSPILMARKVSTVGAAGVEGPPAQPDNTARLAEIVKSINASAGRNHVEKIVDFCNKNLIGFSSTPFDQQIRQAGEISKSILAGEFPPAFNSLNQPLSGKMPEMPTTVASMVSLLNAIPGPNPCAKAINLLCSRDPGFKSLDWAEQCRRGGELVRSIMAGEMPALAANSNPVLNGGDVQAVVDAINAQEGPNPYAKANNLLCSRSPAHKALPIHEQHRIAGEFTREVLAGRIPKGFV